jgi:hypothetical protein
MSITVCLSANTIRYPRAGGHLWVYLNWALGLRSLGCQVIWLEQVRPHVPLNGVRTRLANVKTHLERYGLAERVALCSASSKPLSRDMTEECLDLDAAAEADLLLDLAYGISPEMVGRFRRSALVDIDPGLTQVWMSKGQINVAPHDVYFSIGETVGQPDARFPDCGLAWQYTPPCVALDWWPGYPASADAPFTTVSNWYIDEWVEDLNGWYMNDKRSGFLLFLDLPSWTTQPLELALCLNKDEEERWVMLPEQGWGVRDAWEVTSTPQDYQRYIQDSRGEFSCVKPSCIRLQNAWISDRTLCYLASGKPAVVQHTGPSRLLPDSAGLFRFRDMEEAAHCLEAAAADYERQCRLARNLAEEYFDAQKVVKSVLERALT